MPRWLARGADRTLLATALLFLACAPITLALSFLDQRLLDGVNVWHKPLKFQVSVGVFLGTLACMMPLAGEQFRFGRWGRGVVWVAVATSVFEIAWITLQAGRGERSHYNGDSAFGSAMYAAMGIAAVALSLTPVAIGLAAAVSRSSHPAIRIAQWGAVLGAITSLVGAAGVGLLLGGEPAHYPDPEAAEDRRIPFVGWSLTGGDLRLAHFAGLHALQGLLASALMLGFFKVSPRLAKVVLVVLAAGWVAATIGLARLALRNTSPFSGVFAAMLGG
ncbi:MAG: hypothetical protein AAFX05_00110 [Planctomycetota bacterium]